MNSIELFSRRDELKTVISELRDELKDVEAQLSDTFMPLIKDALRVDGKDFGTVHIREGNQRLKATVSKKYRGIRSYWRQHSMVCPKKMRVITASLRLLSKSASLLPPLLLLRPFWKNAEQ